MSAVVVENRTHGSEPSSCEADTLSLKVHCHSSVHCFQAITIAARRTTVDAESTHASRRASSKRRDQATAHCSQSASSRIRGVRADEGPSEADSVHMEGVRHIAKAEAYGAD